MSIQTAIAHKANTNTVTPADVAMMLQDLKGATFANITYVTDVTLAAAHKAIKVQKVTKANVQLFNSLCDYTDVYSAAVKRSAAKLGVSDAVNIEDFAKSDNYFEHTDCFSVVKHKTQDKYYLFCIYNNATSVYVKDGQEVSKAEVAALMTPSAAKQLLNPGDTVHNVTNDVTHAVTVRTVGMGSIVEMKAMGQSIAV